MSEPTSVFVALQDAVVTRLAGDAFFTPPAPGVAIEPLTERIGDIVQKIKTALSKLGLSVVVLTPVARMAALKHGNGEVDVMRAYKGGLQRASMATTEVKPEYEITLDEYTPNLVAVSLFGTIGADSVQASAVAAALNLASVNVGRSYNVGKIGLSSVSVTAGGVAKVRDLDYQLDEDIGRITLTAYAGGTMEGGTTNSGYPAGAAGAETDFTSHGGTVVWERMVSRTVTVFEQGTTVGQDLGSVVFSPATRTLEIVGPAVE